MKVDTMDLSLSNSTPMNLLNVTADHDRQGQAAHRRYKSSTEVDFASGKGHAYILYILEQNLVLGAVALSNLASLF